jgi:Domain of unknown function (DUF4169)
MSSNIVNLNKFRKAKTRAEQDKRAEENRAKFGRSKEEKRTDSDEVTRRDALLDGAKIEKCDTDLDPGTVS